MIGRLLLPAAALVMSATPAPGQTRIGLGAGVMVSSTLVNDSLVTPLALRAAPGPVLGLTAKTQLDATHQLGIGLGVSWSSLERRSARETIRIGRLSTWTPTLSLQRALGRQFGARLAAGVIIYRPDHAEATVFRSGSPVLPLVGLGVILERGYGGVLIVADLGYDAHRFSTQALRDDGFGGHQMIHRVALTLSVSRAGWP